MFHNLSIEIHGKIMKHHKNMRVLAPRLPRVTHFGFAVVHGPPDRAQTAAEKLRSRRVSSKGSQGREQLADATSISGSAPPAGFLSFSSLL